MSKLLAVILTKNEVDHIGECLATLQWTDGAMLQDSFSDDGTVEVAEALGATVFQEKFVNFSMTRNSALANAASMGATWVLFVDADERVPPQLATEILNHLSQSGSQAVGWWIPRYNIMWGHTMRGGGWYPDHQLRLLKVDAVQYDPNRQVHELAELTGPADYLKEHLLHYNYNSLAHFREKQYKYTNLAANILYEKGITPKPWRYITMPLREFHRRYIKLHGYKDGWHGLQLCALMSWYEFLTYFRLKQMLSLNEK
ncbi:glycosyltransferase family 2 protein [Anaerolineales bacterium HSG24]|nr:glycosyltransferase family 2 protein [Anaerolineales bacterium HSG24]